ncbi:hypothetical protein PG993_014775 [Apiospora rasikravindrae]|uniref:Uncharacterized protein n=1 Tax=Apiospora rasikravindrae TaxID=990691 RepID=A0ABR1RNQ4_9PEZI
MAAATANVPDGAVASRSARGKLSFQLQVRRCSPLFAGISHTVHIMTGGDWRCRRTHNAYFSAQPAIALYQPAIAIANRVGVLEMLGMAHGKWTPVPCFERRTSGCQVVQVHSQVSARLHDRLDHLIEL